MNEAATRTAADAARLPLMLAELRLPTIKRLWPELAEQSNLVPSRQLFPHNVDPHPKATLNKPRQSTRWG